MLRLSLRDTFASLMGRRELDGYRELGVKIKTKDLYLMLGLTDSPMLYKYRDGITKSISADKALVIFEMFDVLIDLWLTEEELRNDVKNSMGGKALVSRLYKPIIDELVVLDAIEDNDKLRRGFKRLIARYY